MKLPRVNLPHGYFIVPTPEGWRGRSNAADLVGVYETLGECVVGCASHYARLSLLAEGAAEKRDFTLAEANVRADTVMQEFLNAMWSGEEN